MPNNKTLISIEGWGEGGIGIYEFEKKIVPWERSLDVYFTDKLERTPFLKDCNLQQEDLPDPFTWRELVGSRILMLDEGTLRSRLSPKNRAGFLPAICLSLAIWGDRLEGIGEQLEDFLIPFNNQLIMSELGGV